LVTVVGREPDELDQAYRRLDEGPAAGHAFVEMVLRRRGEVLPWRHRHLEAATDALVDETLRIVAGQSTFDPAKRSLRGFLKMVVRRKLANYFRGVRRRRAHEAEAVRRQNNPLLVAAGDPPGKALMEAEFEATRLGEVEPLLGAADFRFLVAVREGATRDRLGHVLGAPPEVAPAAIRKAVDRITKKLRRKGIIP
jgi:DNA-directed RNA polymerase specialized sigma24 family protein